MTTFGGLAMPVAVLVAGLLVAYLSLFPAAFAVIVARLRGRSAFHGASLCAAPVWVATELGRQYVWDGFPWALLGYSQVTRAADRAARERRRACTACRSLLALTLGGRALLIVERGAAALVAAVVVAALVAACALWGRMADGGRRRSRRPATPMRVGGRAGQHRAGREVESGAARS